MKMHLWLLAGLVFFSGSCYEFMGKRVKGDGVIKSVEHDVSSFKDVDVSGAIKVYVAQGQTQPVKIEGDENLLEYIEVVQEGEKIFVKNKPGFNLQPTGDMRIYLTSPVYSSIDVSGASDILGQSKITNPEPLHLESSGAGNIHMELDAPKISATITGAGSIYLNGQTKEVDLELSGAGHAHCYDLLSENTKVNISGAGSADVYASVNLTAEVSGVGSVSYKGNPASIDQHVSGVGGVNKAN